MKSSTSNIKIQPLSELRMDKWFIFEKLRKQKYFTDSRFPTILEKAELVSDYTGIPQSEVETIDVEGINNLFNAVTAMIAGHQFQPPPKSLTLGGKKYTFVRKFSRMSAAWHRLVRVSNFKTDPVNIAALCYIERGMKYAQMGEHKEILNPTKDRAKVFEENLPLSTFIDINNFFLRKCSAYQSLWPRILKAREMMSEEMMTSQMDQAKKARREMS